MNKTLEIFAEQNNLKVIPVTYKSQGFRVKRKGYDLCKQDGSILVSFEPVSFKSYNDKWLLRHCFDGNKLPSHLPRITLKWLNDNINVNANCSFKNSMLFK